MLKLFVMLICDSCGESLEPVAVSCDRDPKSWRFLGDEIGAAAQEQGWNLYNRACLCSLCNEDMPCSFAD